MNVRYRAKNSYGGYVIGGGIYSHLNDRVYPTESLTEAFARSSTGGLEAKNSWEDDDVDLRDGEGFDQSLFLDKGFSVLRRVDNPLKYRFIKFQDL